MTDARPLPPDQNERLRALATDRSVLVQAPAGSGKTDLLTRRFLALLATVDAPSEVVAITFTRASAAEMRHRILAELEKASHLTAQQIIAAEESSMTALAAAAIARSEEHGWQLLDLPTQLRITTIDAFCRELALGQPIVSGLGGGMEPSDQPAELYRRAARRTLASLDDAPAPLREAIELLLLWRDNNWAEMEDLLIRMLAQRDRWMRDFVLDSSFDPDLVRAKLERPFANAVQAALAHLDQLFDQAPAAREEALALARFACGNPGGEVFLDLAELPAWPSFDDEEEIEAAQRALLSLATLLLTGTGTFRKSIDKRIGFPANRKREKASLLELIAGLNAIDGFESALAALRTLPPARFSDEEWQIVRAAFTLLVHAAVNLRIVFAEAGQTDFTEIAQTALNVLKGEEGLPEDATLAFADGIHHLLVDEFQDTSRRQHELLAHLVSAWPDAISRTCFVVGDPMQSIYFFRDAEAELFARVRSLGLELPDAEPLTFDFAQLRSNFRTEPALVSETNTFFERVFAHDDGSGVTFASAAPSRAPKSGFAFAAETLQLHLDFIPASRSHTGSSIERESRTAARTAAHQAQIDRVIALIREHHQQIKAAAAFNLTAPTAEKKKYRVAVLGRSRKSLAPIAEALHKEKIPFRAVDLEGLKDRPEIQDALALGRAALNPQNRVAWLGVLRAPWCGLSLADLHALVSGDEQSTLRRSVPSLLKERVKLLSAEGTAAVERLLTALDTAPALRFAQSSNALGSWLEQLWLSVGGAACANPTAHANLDLLWQTLDDLPAGEQDLLGPALDAALADLTALADPTVQEECGVQLMTMHKSKGLEFEVVIVPELQATSGAPDFSLLTWLERGLAEPDESGALSEFLVAPLQSKGDESGSARAWVTRVRRERERQEMRRLLYVAATRAREELHLFARPACTVDANGELTLSEPKNSLLATAWPALEETVRTAFSAWATTQKQEELETETVELAAAAEDAATNLHVLPAPEKPTHFRRLPVDFALPVQALEDSDSAANAVETNREALYARHEGGMRSRLLGVAAHALLEELARARMNLDWPDALDQIKKKTPAVLADLRARGLDLHSATNLTTEALALAEAASRDPLGQWVLAPHTDAASEQRWTGVVQNELRSVQADRIFRAGAEPHAAGENVWWIVDYKTAHADGLELTTALPELRKKFAGQLEAYAKMLRNLKGSDVEVRLALYYPRLQALDWWSA
ncbi:UvrD-helicase domain-containing protein [Telmatobacter bradus]|uniref:UvrD-helicase domain-containing protein n=1 Tax=Telmatobacter bradus TaxID=474953 RepID=UPI003B431400